MTIANNMGFKSNGKKQADTCIANYEGSFLNSISNPYSWIAKNGDSANLHLEGQDIYVIEIIEIDSVQLKGTINGFTGTNQIHYQGLELDQEITFNHEHVLHLTQN